MRNVKKHLSYPYCLMVQQPVLVEQRLIRRQSKLYGAERRFFCRPDWLEMVSESADNDPYLEEMQI